MADQPAPQIEGDAPKPGTRPPLTLTEVKTIVDQRFDEDKGLREEWGVFKGYYENDYWADEDLEGHDSEVSANYFFSNIQQILPLMTDQRPIWHVRARMAFMQGLMTHWNEALGYQWFRQHMDMKVPMAYLDALVSETGFFKVTWDPDADDLRGDLRIDVTDPSYMVFAKGYDELADCPWVGQKKKEPLSWVRDYYPETGRPVVPDSQAHNDSFNPDQMTDFGARNEWVTVYELWLKDDEIEEAIKEQVARDLRKGEAPQVGRAQVLKKKKYPNGRFVTFAAQGKSGPVMLEERASPYAHGRSPWVPVYDYRKQHQIWGLGECRQIRTLVLELQKTLQYIAHALHNYSKSNWEVDSQIQDAEKVQDTFHLGGQFYVKKSSIDGKPGITPIQPSAVPRQFFEWVRATIDIIEEISGVTELSKGVQEKRARQTAQEISTIIETSYTRSRQRVRNLEWSIEQVCTLALEVMMQNYDDEREFSVRGDDQGIEFGKISNSTKFASSLIKGQVPGKRITEPITQRHANAVEEADQDIAQLMKMFGDTDKVLAAFDIEMQSTSTLPLDKQTIANMALRLVQMKVIDEEAALDALNFPNRKTILERMRKREKEMAQAQAKGGAPRQQAGRRLPQSNPTDVQDDMRSRLTSVNGGGG